MTSRPRSIHPLDTLWQAKSLIRTVMVGLALAGILAIAPGVSGDRLIYFAVAAFATQWIILISFGVLYLCRSWLARLSPPRIAQLGLAALLLSTWLVCWLGWLALGDLWPVPDRRWLSLTWQLTGIALTVGLIALVAFHAQWNTHQLTLRAKQADLEALQARIRPHFLFNTINTGIALVHDRPDAAEQLLLALSDLFRAAISDADTVVLEEELALTRRYLEIEQLRFGHRLEVRWNIPGDIEGLPVELPPLSIQPLVENAVKHGIEPQMQGGHISISARRTDDAVMIVVRNRACGSAASAGHGIGLEAVSGRIEAFTGGEGSLATRVEHDEYVAELSVPFAQPRQIRAGVPAP